MKAEDLADLVGARSVRGGKWIGICPAHRDEGLVITKGCKRAAQVNCREGCSIIEIRKSLGLTRREFECPPAPLPNLLEMSDEELKAFRAAQRERQAQHAAICERIRTLRERIGNIEEEIRKQLADEPPQDLTTKLDKTEEKLRDAQSREVELRDLDPSFRLWDAEDTSDISVRKPWGRLLQW
jgi:DNA-binding protein H-NS